MRTMFFRINILSLWIGEFLEDWIQNHKVNNKTKVLIIKDSFVMPIAGFLSLNVSELRMIDRKRKSSTEY